VIGRLTGPGKSILLMQAQPLILSRGFPAVKLEGRDAAGRMTLPDDKACWLQFDKATSLFLFVGQPIHSVIDRLIHRHHVLRWDIRQDNVNIIERTRRLAQTSAGA
jgi:hypothetical protein